MYEPTGRDFLAARHLTGFTQSIVATAAGVSALTLLKFEQGKAIPKASTLINLGRLYRHHGVTFVGPGLVTFEQWRAPTVEAVGQLSGPRLAAARDAVDMTLSHLSMVSRVPLPTLRKIEALAAPLESGAAPPLVYRVFNTLEDLGFRFGRKADDDRKARARPLL